ncbi:MAG: ATP-binding protein, partial [Actinomycetota bacterium]|nr:ATP-binding protein [Actinomycetota bacterium]
MDGPSMLLGGLLGLLVGIVSILAFRFSERAQHSVPPQPVPELDEGLVRTLAVLRSAAVVLDDDDVVVRASPLAYALGVVQSGGRINPEIAPIVAAVRRDGVIQDTELELSRGKLGQSELLLQVRVAQVTPRHLLVLADDLTQARRLEAIRRDFVVNVSHELKTPVGALSLLAETVEDAADDAEAVRRFAGTMRKEATRLAALVHEIIELSRLQVAGALQQPGIVDVDKVIAEAAERAQTTATAKGVALTASAAATHVYGDHAMLVTAVRNLVDNAVAYSEAGSHVGIGASERDGVVEIAVVDQGAGIPPEQQVRIFERFY